MKSLKPLLLAASLAFTACSGTAAPEDWVGKELPRLAVEFLDKKPDLKGKPALIEFWATWCPPCKAMIPHLNELHKKYAPKGLVMIGVSTDEDAKTIADFRKKEKIDYTVALDKGLSEKLGVVTIPHAFLVTKDGKIVWYGSPIDLTAADLDKVVK